jgi:uncharacterized membrane protein YidH (DUF202 family)
MDKIKKISFVIAFSLLQFAVFAQQQLNVNEEDKTDFMRSNGKIYVVLAVVLTIVIGLFIYLNNLDKKISKLEKNKKN